MDCSVIPKRAPIIIRGFIKHFPEILTQRGHFLLNSVSFLQVRFNFRQILVNRHLDYLNSINLHRSYNNN
jgi:hypothetical protein